MSKKDIIHPNTYFDQIYLINLPRRPDKLTQVLWGLDQAKIRVRVMAAVDGTAAQLHHMQDKIPGGAYGYYLTWQQVLKDAQQMKYHRILILDDDVVLCHDFLFRFDQWIRQRQKQHVDWRILLLGATQHVQMTLPRLAASSGSESGSASRSVDVYAPNRTDGSFAVALQGQNVFQDLLSQIDAHQPKYVDSDLLRGLYVKPAYLGKCWVAWPNLMIASVVSSDIRTDRNQAELASKVGWNLSQYRFPLTKPLVSLIVPCYNSERTIKRCLLSLISQTYRPLEVIVVDDGSSDHSFQIVAEIFHRWNYLPKSKDLTYQLIRHEKNRGCYAARNSGIQAANGELIGFQDADDISLDYRIEDQVNALLTYQVLFSTCNILRTHLHYLPIDYAELGDAIQRTRIHPHKYCCRSKVGLVTTLFRKEVFTKWGLYPNKKKWGEDAIYLRRLFPEIGQEISMMNYLNDHQYLPGKHYRVSEILYLSHEMTAQNLTIQRKNAKKALALKP